MEAVDLWIVQRGPVDTSGPAGLITEICWAYGRGWGRSWAGGRNACDQPPSCCPWRCCRLHLQPLYTAPPGPGSVWSVAGLRLTGSQCSARWSKWTWERSCSKCPPAKNRQREGWLQAPERSHDNCRDVLCADVLPVVPPARLRCCRCESNT